MIKDEIVAAEIHALAFEYYKRLHASFIKVKENCSEEETKNYRKSAGKVMGYTITEILMELEKNHPHLKPKEDDFKQI